MTDEIQDKQIRQRTRVRSMMDYIMGTVFFLIGVYFLVYKEFGLTLLDRKPSNIDYLIGLLFVSYGSWRIYRGYKKNYFK